VGAAYRKSVVPVEPVTPVRRAAASLKPVIVSIGVPVGTPFAVITVVVGSQVIE
jgi:hypothetical protein